MVHAAHRSSHRPSLRAVAAWASTLLAAAILVSLPSAAVHAATNPCSPVVSAVACENSLPGNPESDWFVNGSGDSTIQGFATQMSANLGDTVQFKVNTNAKAYTIDIYRLGYYQGNGARKIAGKIPLSVSLPQNQPACQTFSSTGLIDCGNWAVSASWTVPTNVVSGVYVALLTRTDTGGASWIPFVVRNDAATTAMVFQTDDETWEAYNTYGGNSLYQCNVACPPGNPQAYKGAFKVSYNRPFLNDGTNYLTVAELPMIRFMEANGYDLSYIAGIDAATRGSLLLNHKTYVTAGHDEYWSYDQRANVEAARDHGVNIAMFTGNEIFWRTRWESSQAGPTTSGRTLVCYKDTHFNEPTDPVTWTGAYADPRFGTATGGGNPQNALSGQLFNVNSGTTDIKVPAQYASMRLWRNTAVAKLTGTQSITLGSGLGTLGYEWDIDANDGFRPAGLFDLSSTTDTNAEVFTDYGSTTATGKTQTHHLTEYRAPSGALVFGAGTVQWSWGLDNFTTGGNTDLNMQQATVNLFSDMGVQPVTPMAGLVAATSSADTTAPTSVITSPTSGTTADGTAITIKGTASDTGGGVVAGVEVSTDGGTTWHPATGTTAWTYSWVVHGNPSVTIKSRAVDDSGNLESPSSGVTLNVPCPCSVLGTGATPANPDSGDPNSVELGTQFKSDVNGTVTGVRFYKATGNSGTHVGNLWTTSGTNLASATFTGETSTGWQTVTFSKPVAITAGTNYIVSYFAPKGHYSEDTGYFFNNPSPPPAGADSVDSPPLHFTRSLPATPNGFYAYNGASTFPNQIFNAENYWVDPVFTPSANPAPAVTSTTPSSGATGVAISSAPTATFNQAVTASSVTFTLKDANNNAVAGTTSLSGSGNVATFTPSSSLAYSTTYTATVSGATNSTGQTMASPYSWSFTTAAPPPAPTVSSTSPASGATGVAVSVAPSATFSQAVTPSSVTFTLKDGTGASVTGTTSFNGANTTVTFTPSAALAYNTTYTATVSGATNSTGQTMANPYSWSFTTVAAPPAPAVSSTSPASGATGVAVSVAPSATFNQAVTPSSVTFTLKDGTGASVSGTASFNGANTVVTFTPSSSLAYSTTYTATVSGATNSTGQTMANPYSWSFTTVAAPPPPAVSSTSPASGATGVAVTVTPSATFSQAVTASSVTFTLKDANNNAVAGTTALNNTNTVATFTPSSSLAYSTTYTATVSGATNSTGQTMSPYSWSFTTVAAPPAPNVSSTNPSPGATGVAVNSVVSATFSQDVTASSIQFVVKDPSGASVAGSLSYSSATTTATFTPSAALANNTQYTVTVSGATNSTGQTMSPYSWSFTTVVSYSCPCSVFPTSATPATVNGDDPSGVELGMKFQTTTNGQVTGVRFYKGAGNTGTHVGNLWSASGTKLATVTFVNESSGGWQQAYFSTPVSVTANTTYVISYYAPNGNYSYTSNGFSSQQGSAPIVGLASGSSGGNGVYAYGAASSFPTGTYGSTNYWVDAVFNAGGPSAPVVIGTSPSQGATGVAVTTTVSATFDQAVDTSAASFTLSGGGTSVAGTTGSLTATGTYTFTPSASLASNTTYTATVSGVKSATGQAMPSSYSWSFTTGASPYSCPCSVFGASSVPATVNVNDPNAVELGMQFTSDISGSVTAIKFYKGSQNTGTHVGHLWTAGGTLLGTVTFSSETASGWQTATLSSPVAISANTTYVVSYYAPNGFYSANGGYFSSSGADAPPLHGLQSTASHLNGVYKYGTSGFPTSSYNATNYWVDLVFTTP